MNWHRGRPYTLLIALLFLAFLAPKFYLFISDTPDNLNVANANNFIVAGKEFRFPSKFTAKNKLSKDLLSRNSLAELCIHYNTWGACRGSESISSDGGQDIVRIWVSDSKKSRAEFYFELFPKNSNGKEQGDKYFWEEIDNGHILHEKRKDRVVKSYIFMAEDGDNVLILGVDDKTPIYQVYRQIFEGVELMYIYDKDVGSDYSGIDKKVSEWIRSFLVSN